MLRLTDAHVSRRQGKFKRMKLAPSPICNCGLEDQTAEHILQRCPLLRTAGDKRVANGSPATHQSVRQQGGTAEDGHIHLADWSLRVTAIEKKKKNQGMSAIHIDFIYLLSTLNIFFGIHQCLVQLLCLSLWPNMETLLPALRAEIYL